MEVMSSDFALTWIFSSYQWKNMFRKFFWKMSFRSGDIRPQKLGKFCKKMQFGLRCHFWLNVKDCIKVLIVWNHTFPTVCSKYCLEKGFSEKNLGPLSRNHCLKSQKNNFSEYFEAKNLRKPKESHGKNYVFWKSQ